MIKQKYKSQILESKTVYINCQELHNDSFNSLITDFHDSLEI